MKINNLTSLRFLAAMAVFLHHLHYLEHLPIPILNTAFKGLFEGFVGVNFFYVLSGFVITYSYQESLKQGTLSKAEFFFRRFARIYPAFALMSIVAIFLYKFCDLKTFEWVSKLTLSDIPKLLANFTLTQSFIPANGYAFYANGVSWSISDEVFFYTTFCFIATFSSRKILGLSTALLLLIIFHMALMLPHHPNQGWIFYINPIFRLIDFLSGILLCRLFWHVKYTPSFALATSLEALSSILLLLFMIVGIKLKVNIILRFDLYYLAPISLLIFVFAHNKGLFSTILRNKYLIYLGEASFSLYLVHQPLIHLMNQLFLKHVKTLRHALLYSSIILLLGILLSIFLFTFFEKPLNRKLRVWWSERSLRARTKDIQPQLTL